MIITGRRIREREGEKVQDDHDQRKVKKKKQNSDDHYKNCEEVSHEETSIRVFQSQLNETNSLPCSSFCCCLLLFAFLPFLSFSFSDHECRGRSLA